MSFVITRLCRDCVDGACVDACPVDAIVKHVPPQGASDLPNQLFIDPDLCISCRECEPACPWEAIFDEDDVPVQFRDDIELNAVASARQAEFHVPVERLRGQVSAEQVAQNRRKWGL